MGLISASADPWLLIKLVEQLVHLTKLPWSRKDVSSSVTLDLSFIIIISDLYSRRITT